MPKAISIRKIDGKPGKVYYPLEHITVPDTPPKANEVVVKITAAALNHRDLFLRQHLYPGTTFGVPLLADGTGIVTSTGSSPAAKKWQGKRVIINPGSGWKDDPEGPESPKGYSILGGTKMNPLGTLGETVTIDAGELEDAPSHLSSIEAAALPLTGLTAWRATMVKSGNAQPGKNILITGIGGGVAIMALLFAAAAGANVYVSSGSQEKIDRAKTMGAKGGVNYKEKGWEKTLKALLPKDRAFLDAIIDGAGGDVVEKGAKLLKVTSSYYLTSYIHCNHFTDILFFSQPGGVISIYGMTTSPTMPFQMAAVLKNIEVRGSTMGSRKEFADMVKFVQQKNLKPIVSRSVSGGLDNLEGIDSLFEDMKAGKQFGKLVIEVSKEREAKL
jgi:NADPH:quinone reductase-like Zn-dependent oxidoreductase